MNAGRSAFADRGRLMLSYHQVASLFRSQLQGQIQRYTTLAGRNQGSLRIGLGAADAFLHRGVAVEEELQ